MKRRTTVVVAALLGSWLASATAGGPPPVLRTLASGTERAVLALDRAALAAAVAAGRPLDPQRVSLRPGETETLRLEPWRVTGPGTRFVLGRREAPDLPLPFDPSSVTLLRGEVAERPGSSVFLAVGRHVASGTIDLGPGAGRYAIALAPGGTEPAEPARLALLHARSAARPPHVPECSLLDEHAQDVAQAEPLAPEVLGAGAMSPGPRLIRLALETDHELFVLFDGAEAAAEYLVALYGEISAIYERDVNARVELTFVRLWDNPADMFNEPSPLSPFRNWWNANMSHVPRDAAQLLSGRRDYPFGGQAYLSSLCGPNAYSVVGYALGFYPDPGRPSVYCYDVSVPAHELGHNAGTGHTHDAANLVDECDDPTSKPRRGTIMSYCSQTWSGGNANRDLYFHAVIQGNIETHIGSAACIVLDCNRNGVDDADDVAGGSSADTNGNGVPDECEDCNKNGVLDGQEIAGGSVADVNANGIPDPCEPDCNGNGQPDGWDIARGSLDAYGNLVPDECEEDCDGDGISDFTEIQNQMTLDIDRDARLDDCQDCDGDGAADRAELGAAHDVWVVTGQAAAAPLRRFHALSGVEVGLSTGPPVRAGHDLLATPDGRLLVSSSADNRIAAYASSGASLGTVVSTGLSSPAGLALRADGALLVANRGAGNVLAFDATTGAPLGVLVPAGSGGLGQPFGLTIGPSGELFVTSEPPQVLRFDASSGSFLGAFVPLSANGGLEDPRGIAFKPDGNLLVASAGTNEVLEYDGASGAPLGRWAQAGTTDVLTQVSPWGIRVGPNGNVFVSRTGQAVGAGAGAHDDDDHHDGDHHHAEDDIVRALHLTNAQIYEYDVRNGNFLRAHVAGNDHGLSFPTAFDFVPGWSADCNFNQVPDSCDVSESTSLDTNGDGVPDECQVDCNQNGIQDRLDIVPYGSALDCNANLVPDGCEIASGTSQDCDLDGVPDECTAVHEACCAVAADCDDALACTIDSCTAPPGDCSHTVAAGHCLIEGACRADGEPDPTDACRVCDPADPLGWSPAPLPAEVTGVALSAGEGETLLAWEGAGPRWDVAGGSLDALRADGGTAAAECLANDLTRAAWTDAGADPPPGEGTYYLVRAQDDCGAGSWGQASDGTRRAPTGACP